jgi:DNA-binding IclR family transcriptional regulator
MQENVQLVERTLNVMECLCEQEHGYSLKKLSEVVGLNQSTVYRILCALMERDYVKREPESNNYMISNKMISLASSMLDQVELKATAYPLMKELSNSTGNTAYLGTLQGSSVVYLEKVAKGINFRTGTLVGAAIPAYKNPIGKMLMSAESTLRKMKMIEQFDSAVFNANTFVKGVTFLEELDEINSRGYAIDNSENTTGEFFIAAPIKNYLGKVIAAIGLSGPTMQLSNGILDSSILAVCKAAKRISEDMGYKEKPLAT